MSAAPPKPPRQTLNPFRPDLAIERLAEQLFYALTLLPGAVSDKQKKLGQELFRFLARERN